MRFLFVGGAAANRRATRGSALDSASVQAYVSIAPASQRFIDVKGTGARDKGQTS